MREEYNMSFKVIRGRFPSDVEHQLNEMSENYNPVDVQAITYDHNTSLYTIVCKVGQEVLPCTTYNELMIKAQKPLYGDKS